MGNGIDDRDMQLKETITSNFILSLLLGVMLTLVFLMTVTICHSNKKEKLDTEKSTVLSSNQSSEDTDMDASKRKFKPIGCLKANVQTINGTECTMLYFKNQVL